MKKLFTIFAVAVLAFAAQAEVLTICDGTETNSNVPISGFNYDLRNTMSQMIYPAEKLADMVNGQITEVKFYATAGFELGVNTIQLSFKQVEEESFDNGAVTETTAVATGSTVVGETELVFTLDEPYEYNGGNLLIETLLTSAGTFRTTYWYGMNTGYASGYYQYQFNWGSPFTYTENFLPKVTFTYEPADVPPVEPTELTAAPTFNGYTTDGVHAYFVEIVPTEPSVIYYRVQYPDGTWTEWAEYEDILSFTGNGMYRVEAYAVADGKLPSYQIAYEFVVSPVTGLTEMAGDKTVASQRYFNAAGQEMSEANGVTIVVTTYTDGTTSTVKVVK